MHDALFASRMTRMKASEIRELLKLLDQPGIISFAGGIPDPNLFPARDFADAIAGALTPETQAQALQYSVSEGYEPLRRWIADRMRGIGVPCDLDNVVITSGSQQALDYLGKLYLSKGDTALVQWPTYLGALAAFNAYEPHYAPLDLPTDSATRSDGSGPVKFAYVSPDFANPTGATMDLAQREALLDRVEALDCALIEDGAYQALRYDGPDIPPILALELARKGDLDACRTIYCGSFSKTLSPGLRLGWVVAARSVISRLVLLKQAGDLHTASLNQMAICDVAERCFDVHVAKLKGVYRARRDAMLAAMNMYLPDDVSWSRPEGGMFVWVTLPPAVDGGDLLRRAIEEAQLAFVPGQAFHADGSGANTIRLSFSCVDEEQIQEGIRRLGDVLRMVT